MKVLYAFVLAVLCFLSPALSYAQDKVLMRTSSREDYSRVIFEWGSDVSYTQDEAQDGVLILSFSKGAALDQAGAKLRDLQNITGMQIVSENPLKISFNVPEASKTRVFKTAGRIFLDVYNPPGVKGKAKKEEKTVEAKSAEKPKVDKAEEKKTAESGDAKPVAGNSKMAAPPAFVLVPEVLRPETQTKEEKSVQAADPASPEKVVVQDEHFISVTSTATVDMAIFENAGELWYVMDRSENSLTPSLNSPTPQIFSAFEPVPLSRGMAYRTILPEGLKVKSQGGGLVWRLMLGKNITPQKSVQPTRQTGTSEEFRGGTVIWPFTAAEDILDVVDPFTGQKLKVVTVGDAVQGAGEARKFVEFDVLPSYAGMVIRPKVDDLEVKITEKGVEVTRKGGLVVMPEAKMSNATLGQKPFVDLTTQKTGELPAKQDPHAKEEKKAGEPEKKKPRPRSNAPRVFNFTDWQTGGMDVLNNNKTIILSEIKEKEKPKQIEDIMKLAKMHLAHGRGAEALGFLRYAEQELPALAENPEFLALRGVARAFTWKSEIALTDLIHKDLARFDEIKYWKAFVLADLGDWKQAGEILPDDYSALYDYPNFIAHRLALVLAEVNLRAGKLEQAEELLALVEDSEETLDLTMKSALQYLRGEALRQKGKKEEAIEIWEKLAEDKDDLYRAKARLALTVLLADMGKIDNKKAIDMLEPLRYAWRGDQLEAQIHYWLGQFYFKEKEFVKGLNMLRDAAAIAVDTQLGQKIAEDMRRIFTDLFLGDDLKNVSPLDAFALYEQFKELTPIGEKGNRMVQALAEHMVKADILGRAAELLRGQVDHRLEGDEKARIAVRLAAIEILDDQPAKALESLAKADGVLSVMPDSPSKAARVREISLLKARAYADNKQVVQALSILESLPPSRDVNRLKADIAWAQGYWEDAGAALDDVLMEENISADVPLTDLQSDLIMNRAIALSLANDRIEIANMRDKYLKLMKPTKKAHQFEMITRARQNSELADRKTLESVMSEVQLFQDFLESYRKGN